MLPQIQQAGQYATQSVNRDVAAALGAVGGHGCRLTSKIEQPSISVQFWMAINKILYNQYNNGLFAYLR